MRTAARSHSADFNCSFPCSRNDITHVCCDVIITRELSPRFVVAGRQKASFQSCKKGAGDSRFPLPEGRYKAVEKLSIDRSIERTKGQGIINKCEFNNGLSLWHRKWGGNIGLIFLLPLENVVVARLLICVSS